MSLGLPSLAAPAAITAARLKLFAPRCDELAWASALQAAATRYDIATPRRVRHWLAQLSHESRGLTVLEEDLHYRTPEVLDRTFAGVHGAADAAELIRRGPRAIANRVYARRNGNGDEASGDGWRYRGMGPLQLTGRTNVRAAGEAIGVDLVAQPELLLTPRVGALAAAWFFERCLADADADDLEGVTRGINGAALAGLDDRRTALQRAATIWRDPLTPPPAA